MLGNVGVILRVMLQVSLWVAKNAWPFIHDFWSNWEGSFFLVRTSAGLTSPGKKNHCEGSDFCLILLMRLDTYV